MRQLLAGARALLTRYTPTSRLAVVVAVTSLLWLLPAPVGEYAGLGGLTVVVVLAAADFLLLPTRHSLRIEREFPNSVGIGDSAVGTYTVHNGSPRPVVVEFQHQLPALVTGSVGHALLQLEGDATLKWDENIVGATRGVAALGPVGVRATTRLGFIAASYVHEPGGSVRVIPSLSGVGRYRLLAMHHHLTTVGVRALRRRGSGQAFANLREYVVGDDPRHIDWKATSKKGKYITREFTVERSQTVITLIDAGRGMTQLSGTQPRFEHALSSALVLTDVAANTGDRVGTLVFDDEVRAFVPAQTSKGALHLVRDAFIPVTASSNEPDYAAAFRFLAARQGKRALIVFFTDVIDVRASQSLVAHVTRSSARHLVLVVALRNDALFEAARLRPDASSDTLYAIAAAEEVIHAREAVLQRMRRAGVIVLDVSPRTMTTSVVNQYLELKSRGAL